MTKWWLARDGIVYGPYSESQIRDMSANNELIETDVFNRTDSDNWITKELLLQQTAKRPSINVKSPRTVEKASTEQKSYMKVLGLPVTPSLSMADARVMIGKAIAGGALERLKSSQNAERRISYAMGSINGGGTHDRGFGHPLKYVKKRQLQSLLEWLDAHYPGWDSDAWGKNKDPYRVYDAWLVPGVATIFPELIKETYIHNFGVGKTWRILA